MKAIVLAAGKGVRMQSDLPKVLHQLKGKPLLRHVTDTLTSAGVEQIVLVVGYEADRVRQEMGDSFTYVYQEQQLGTGHAVLQAEDALRSYSGPVIVTCGDAPLISIKSYQKLKQQYDSCASASILTMKLNNPFGYGRIIRDAEGFVKAIVEEKDATQDQKQICEVNVGTYIFESSLLFEGLKKTGNNNTQNEYYLPDMIDYICSNKGTVTAVVLDSPVEGSGVNSKEQLAQLEESLNVD